MLRPYQQSSIDGLRRSISTGHKAPILVAPTGSGKTHVAVEVIQGATAKGKKVLFLAPRRELIYQATDRLTAHGVDCGIIMAGEPRESWHPVQVASFDTLHARGVRRQSIPMPDADVVIVDEAHLSIAKTRRDIIQHYRDQGAIIVGLTATPARGDGRGLGEIYDDIVQSISMQELVEQGFLVPARYYAPSKPDLAKLKITNGDYVVSELDKRVNQPKLVGDVIDNWQRIAPDRQTVVFAVTRSHANHIARAFEHAGVETRYLDGETPLDERAQLLDDMATGKAQVLVNVFVATFGWDCPSVSCVVLARPTRNITLYLQTAGRGLRPAPGKDDCVIIDHAGAVEQHGFVDDAIPWTLDSRTDIRKEKERLQAEKKEPKEITCSQCKTVFKGSRTCPTCGHHMVPPGKAILTHGADLREIKRGQVKRDDKQVFWNACLYKAFHLNRKCGMAAHLYKQKFGVWPRGLDKLPKGSQWQMPAKQFIEELKHG